MESELESNCSGPEITSCSIRDPNPRAPAGTKALRLTASASIAGALINAAKAIPKEAGSLKVRPHLPPAQYGFYTAGRRAWNQSAAKHQYENEGIKVLTRQRGFIFEYRVDGEDIWTPVYPAPSDLPGIKARLNSSLRGAGRPSPTA